MKKTTSKTTASETIDLPEATGTDKVCKGKCKIAKLDYDFGRGDLNLMRDKINEIIENGN